MRAKLRTVAASNNRDHARNLSIACSRYIYYGVIVHAHPVRGESHNQRNTTGEVATQSLYYCLLCLIYVVLFFAHIPFVVNHTFNTTPTERLQQYQQLETIL